MKKLIVYIAAIVLLTTGCNDGKTPRNVAEWDALIRSNYPNTIITKLSLVEREYYPKWLIKTTNNEIIFIQHYDGSLIEQKIF